MTESIEQQIHARRIRDWLLVFLRFAVTRDEADRADVMAAARDLDRGSRLAASGFGYFTRTAHELCAAALDVQAPQSLSVLRQHLKRIEDERLRRSLEAALGLATAEERRPVRLGMRNDLWKGLAQRTVSRP
jgi:hypothetical protein